MIQENLIKILQKTNERFTEEYELAFDDFVWDRINKTDTKKCLFGGAVTPTFDSTDFINVKH